MTKKEFVSMSLPYGLKAIIPESDTKGCRKTVIGTVGAVYEYGSITCNDTINVCPRWYKPILYPIKMLKKNIEFNGETINPISWLEDEYYSLDLYRQANILLMDERYINQSDFMLVKHMIEWYFDIAGLIEKGQAIDINTLKINPYKKK